MTHQEEIERAGMCGQPGPSLWSAAGRLIPTLCMKIKGHADPHEHLSGEFLWTIDLDEAASAADLAGFMRGQELVPG